MLPNATEQGAWIVAERLRSAFAAAAASVDGLPVAATASVGLSLIEGGRAMDPLFDLADQALYRAKATGRNRVAIAGPELGPAA